MSTLARLALWALFFYAVPPWFGIERGWGLAAFAILFVLFDAFCDGVVKAIRQKGY